MGAATNSSETAFTPGPAETGRTDKTDSKGNRLRELAEAGRIGSLNRRYLSFMGSVTAPGRLIKRTLPQVVPKLIEDRVDIALLVPV